jgi:16S rRNA (cytosine1407-C5)-methyltransferase
LVCRREHDSLVENLLHAQGFAFEGEDFFPPARRLLEEPFPLGTSLASLFGYIYMQDRSSMRPPLALDPPPGASVLDMCASPGSKTGLLAQLVGEQGFVLANEPNPRRLATLRQNLVRLNLLQTGTCSFPGERLPMPPASWEYIQLDPPCSGWGTEKKHPKVRALWKDDKVRPLARLQRRLLEEAARLLAPCGRLVYSTCTTNPE